MVNGYYRSHACFMLRNNQNLVKAGLIGCGAVAVRGLIPGWMPANHPARPTPPPFLDFGGSEGLYIVSLCDPNSHHLSQAHKLLPHASVFSSWSKMRNSVNDLDAIIIATPNNLHEQMVLDALEDNYDVFVEKPLALTYQGIDRICNLSQKKSRIVMLNLPWRFSAVARGLFEAIESGVVGKLLSVQGEFRHAGPKAWAPGSQWYFGQENPGGSLTDLGSHILDIIVTIVGEPVNCLTCHNDCYETYQRTTCQLLFKSGVKGSALMGWDAVHPVFQIVVTGTKGVLCAILAGGFKGLFFNSTKSNMVQSTKISHEQLINSVKGWRKLTLPTVNTDHQSNPFSHFTACLRSRSQPITAANSVRMTEELVVEACSQLNQQL